MGGCIIHGGRMVDAEFNGRKRKTCTELRNERTELKFLLRDGRSNK